MPCTIVDNSDLLCSVTATSMYARMKLPISSNDASVLVAHGQGDAGMGESMILDWRIDGSFHSPDTHRLHCWSSHGKQKTTRRIHFNCSGLCGVDDPPEEPNGYHRASSPLCSPHPTLEISLEQQFQDNHQILGYSGCGVFEFKLQRSKSKPPAIHSMARAIHSESPDAW
jgi:hypothetical protein